MDAHRPQLSVLIAWTATLSLAACSSAPEPLSPPPMRIAVSHFAGVALAPGASESVEAASARSAWAVFARVYSLRRDALAAFDATESVTSGASRNAELLLAPTTADPIRGRAPDLRDVQIAFGSNAIARTRIAEAVVADRAVGLEFAHERAAVADGTSAEFAFVAPDGRSQFIVLSREGESMRIAIGRSSALEDVSGVAILAPRIVPGAAGASASDPAGALWLEWSSVAGPDLVVGVAIQVGQAGRRDRGHYITFERSRAQIEAVRERASARVAPVAEAESLQRRLEVTWQALSETTARRSALLALAGDGPRTRFARDYALTAAEDVVDAWVESLVEPPGKPVFEAEALAWRVTQAGIQVVGSRVDRDVALDSEVGLLLRWFGEAGRFPGDLIRAAVAARGFEDLQTWLVAENRRLLGSSDPAARIRALDWLGDRGLAPATFDPFASRDERRTALRADAAARAASQPEPVGEER